MGSFANYCEDKVLGHVVGKSSFDKPTVSVALSSTDPSDSSTGLSEPSTAYAYKRIATAAADWTTPSSGKVRNSTAIAFPQSTGDWGNMKYFALFDTTAIGAGNMIAHGALGSSKAVMSGDTASFSSGAILITLT
jgi:hypothetical protein